VRALQQGDREGQRTTERQHIAPELVRALQGHADQFTQSSLDGDKQRQRNE